VIKIRYTGLPEGLHARAEALGRRRTIYLVPGLSAAQRREALCRLRRESRIGHGPPLPGPGVALAVAMDTAKSTARNGVAAVRCHPAGSLLLTVSAASVIVCYVLFVSVSIHILPPARGPVILPSPPPTGRTPAGRHHPGATGPGSQVPFSSAASPGTAGPAPTRRTESPRPAPTSSGPSPEPLPPRSPAPDTAPPTPSPSPSDNPGGLCVNVGPLGVCVSL
jgi:hypothetical protein